LKGTLKIATRKSALALWQARYIAKRIKALDEKIDIELVEIVTKGDQWLQGPLYEIGGKGLFIKELELALFEKRADIAVHSVKDIPAIIPEGLCLPVLGFRDSCKDVLVGCTALDELSSGSIVGSSSLRRKTQLMAVRPDLEVISIRGNVDTRLKKLDSGEYDALVLAEAGINRLGIQRKDICVLPIDICLPAPGQGALGIEMLERNPNKNILDRLYDRDSHLCVETERMVSAGLGADCSLPVAALASLTNGIISLRALVGDVDGENIIRVEASDSNPEKVVSEVLEKLYEKGARSILDSFSEKP
jgi:hydroxymethylbilane synthase